MDRKLARQFVRKVSPLEHSPDVRDRKAARKAESKLRRILKTIPKPKERRLSA
jgi:hypothetical protein